MAVALALCSGASVVHADGVRAEIGNPLKQAGDLIKAGKGKEALAKVLEREGYIAGFRVSDNGPAAKTLTIDLKYVDRKRVINGVRRVSTPGLRVYSKAHEIPRVLGGLGVAVVSTSRGLMTDRDARRAQVGGELELVAVEVVAARCRSARARSRHRACAPRT